MKTQADTVVEVMEMLGGVASLQQLYAECAPRFPDTQTPDATVRRIVQMDERLSRLKPGLYCLKVQADAVVKALDRLDGAPAFKELHEACEQDHQTRSMLLPVEAIRQIVQHDLRLHGLKDGRICLAARRAEFAVLQPGAPKKRLQADEVVAKMADLGGVASVKDLYEACKPLFSNWKTKTPDATIRRIVQTDERVRRLKLGGLYCLNTRADEVVDVLDNLGGTATLEQLHEECNRVIQDRNSQLPVDAVHQIARHDRRIHGLGDGQFYLATWREKTATSKGSPSGMGGGKTRTQGDVVVDVLEQLGGIATLQSLYVACRSHFSNWETKTPDATIRRIVQMDERVHKLTPGLYCLKSLHEKYAFMDDARLENSEMYVLQEWEFYRCYYQGRILQLGQYRKFCAYAPPKDRGKTFLRDGGDTLERWVNCSNMPEFGNSEIVESAKSVDVVWFNERDMPSAFYEVAMTDGMDRSLEKLYGMQDFNAALVIVAPRFMEEHFVQQTESAAFAKLRGRVEFWSTDDIEHEVDREARRVFG